MIEVYDLLRVSTITMSGTTICLSVTIMVLYLKRHKSGHTHHLLPFHVWLNVFALLWYVSIGVMLSFSRIGKDQTWMLVAFSGGGLLAVISQGLMAYMEISARNREGKSPCTKQD